VSDQAPTRVPVSATVAADQVIDEAALVAAAADEVGPPYQPDWREDPEAPKMAVEALVLIADDPEAQRLVVTWPRVGLETPELPGRAWPVVARWAEASGVDEDDVARIAAMLWGAAIIGPYGHVAPEARGLIVRRMSKAAGLG
jgi:hypothetical protein